MRPMHQNSLWRFYVVQGLYNMMFFMPTWVIFLQEEHGLTLTQVTLVDLAFWLTMALTEVPTGAVADTYGRKRSILIGMGLTAIAVAMFGWAPNFALLMVANALWGIALTFMSGADMAFFYDTLRDQGRAHEYPRLRGRLTAFTLVGAAAGNILGGVLADWQLGSPFWIYALVLLLGLAIGSGLREPSREMHPETDRLPTYRQTLGIAWAALKSTPRLRLAMLYSNVLPLAAMLITAIFIQPRLVEIGVNLTWMGFIVFAFSLVRIMASYFSGQVSQVFGGKWLWLAAGFVFAGTIGLASLKNLGGVALFGLAVFGSVSARPLIESLILQDAPSFARATVLSVDNLIFRFMLAMIEPSGGWAADQYGLSSAFRALAIGLGLALACLLWLWRPEKAYPSPSSPQEPTTP